MKVSFAILAILLFGAAAVKAQPLAGLWDATVVVNGVTIPFRMEFSGEGSEIKGSFFNGEEKVTSTRGGFESGALALQFEHYATKLEATWKDGRLDGRYGRESRGFYPFEAKRAAPPSLAETDVPSIAGLWNIQRKSPKGESAWRFIVRQSGAEVSAAILRVDGDTGTLMGRYKDGKFVLSHFSGARASLLEIAPAKDGSLVLKLNGKDQLTAVRPAEARAKGLAEPTDPSQHTSVKDVAEPFRFSFPDLSGNIVSNTDERFRNKVVVVCIMGSWCPNCHDEAPFLQELYRTYRSQGLEIVAISFEEADQLEDPARLRAFNRQYGIEYTVLLGGEPGELNAKLPQAVNLNSWPTTYFLGRDGRVRAVYAGFAGRASGEFHDSLRTEVTAIIERLAADNQSRE
jgi:thiol-disulfide isomerase/thioredoxin